MGLISREALREAMYHEAFEMDSDMQKWDSGCWIRYKMFENHLKDAPSVPAVPLETLLKFIEQTEHFTYPPCQNEIEKCRDCKLHYIFGYQKECWKRFLTKWMEEEKWDIRDSNGL